MWWGERHPSVWNAFSNHLGAAITVPQTEWLRSNRNSFLTVLEAGKSEIEADSVSGEGPLPGP